MLALSLRGVNDNEVVKRTPEAKTDVPVEPDPRWKIEEEKRQKLEEQMNQLRELVAKKVAETPQPSPLKLVKTPAVRPPKVLYVYRAAQNSPQRIKMDDPGVTTLRGPLPPGADLSAAKSAPPFGIDAMPETEPDGEPRS
jgi:hypothetical protein